MSHVIAYAYEAALHCPECASVAGMTGQYAEDAEGNAVGVVFSTDEVEPGWTCDTCHTELTDPLPTDEDATTVQVYPNGVEHVDNETTAQYVNLTPVGLQTPEGVARTNAAHFALEAAVASVSREATEMFPDLEYFLNDAHLSPDAYEDVQDILAGLREAIGKHTEATEVFLRAIAGAPPRACPMFTLKNAVVLDLPRKSRNGTRFTFQREGNYPIGYGTVLKTSKDGLVTASVDGLMEQMQFHTSDKTVWPNAKPKVG